MRYACRAFAFGEIGLNSYRMLEAANIIGFSCPDQEISDALSKLQRFAEEEAEPVLLEATDYDLELLRMEDGRPITPFLLSILHNFRYLGDLSSLNATRISLKDIL